MPETLYDISMTLSPDLPSYPGDPPLHVEPAAATAPFRVTRFCCGSHSGTHIDAPAHLLPGGMTVDTIPLSLLLGPCLVADLSGRRGPIGVDLLAELPLDGQSRLLLRTDNSALWGRAGFSESYTGLTAAGAAWLMAHGVRLVGIDYLSVEPFGGDGATHRTLLEAGAVILEGLDLSGVAAGEYELLCLPLKLAGGDGAPCRAVLRRLTQDVK